ncbi:MAG: DUF4105 domain-containing protein [Proteobacteria bacterium]|nr:DUF4105 domain-containing protein [Pseudomonadota bacterium]
MLNVLLKIVCAIILVCITESTIFCASDRLIDDSNLSTTRVFLQTIGRGKNLPDLYGHNQLRIADPVSRKNFVVSWGLYNDRDPMFPFNFYLGRAKFLVAAIPFSKSLEYYRAAKRYVDEDEFVLTLEQKKLLIRRLESSLQPDSNSYLYKIYEDNCSTRLRDVIDELLGGAIRASFDTQVTGVSVREILDKHQSAILGSSTILHAIANSQVDRPLSAWEIMYLPHELQSHLKSVINPATQKPLMVPHQRLVEFPEPKLTTGKARDGFIQKVIGGLFFFGVLILVFQPKLQKKVSSNLKVRAILVANRINVFCWLALGTLIWWVLFANHVLTDHVYLKSNAILVILGPLDIIFGWQISYSAKWQSRMIWYVGLRLGLMALVMFAFWMNLITQDISIIYFYMAPLTVFLIIYFLGQKGRSEQSLAIL